MMAEPQDVHDKNVTLTSPRVEAPGAVVVSVTGNGQQFINDITMHYRDN